MKSLSGIFNRVILTLGILFMLSGMASAQHTSSLGNVEASGYLNVRGPTALTGLAVNPARTSLQVPQTGALVQITGDALSPTRFEADAYGAAGYFSGVRADGTLLSPTSILSGEEIGGYNAFGYNGLGFVGPSASLRSFAAENWSSGHQGTYIDIATTPIDSTTLTEVIRFYPDGGIAVPGATGGDEGPGTLNLVGLSINGGAQVFPASGDLVGTTDTQTLSNKTLTGPIINNGALSGTFSGNPTFSGTVNNTGTFQIGGTPQTFPGSGLIVGTTDTQTLSNKTFTSPTINSAALSGTFSGSPTFSGAMTLDFSGNALTLGASSNATIGGSLSAGTGSAGSINISGGVNPLIESVGTNTSILFQPNGTGGFNFRNGAGALMLELVGNSNTVTTDALQYVSNSTGPATFTASISGTVMSITSITSGVPGTGGQLSGPAAATSNPVATATRIINQLTGPTGGIGTYTITPSQTVASTTITQIGTAVTIETSSAAPIFIRPNIAQNSTLTFNNNGVAATTNQKLNGMFDVTGLDTDLVLSGGIYTLWGDYNGSNMFSSAPFIVNITDRQIGTGYVLSGGALNIAAVMASTPTPIAPWTATTAYAIGGTAVDSVDGSVFITFNGGTSGSTQPTNANCASSCTDGTVTWQNNSGLFRAATQIGYQSYATANFNQNGAATVCTATSTCTGGPIGLLWGELGGATVAGNATYMAASTSKEIDILISPTGSQAPQTVTGLSIDTLVGTGGAPGGQGQIVDASLILGGNTQLGSYYGRKNAIILESDLDPNSGVGFNIYDYRGTEQFGAGVIDASQVHGFAGTSSVFGNDAPFVLRSPYYDLLTTGDIREGYSLLHNGTNGPTWDVTLEQVTGLSINSFSGTQGINYTAGAEVCDTVGNCATVATTDGSGRPASLTLYTNQFLPSTAIPANPVTWHAVSISSLLGPTGFNLIGNTFTVNETYSAVSSPTITLGGTATVNLAGAVQIAGTPQTFPASGLLVGTTDTQTLTNKTLTSPTINSGALSGTFSGTSTFSGSTTFDFAGNALILGASSNATIGGSMSVTGNITTGSGTSTSAIIAIDAAAAHNRFIQLFTGGTGAADLRWDLGANNTAESGSNAGSDLVISGFSDSGASLGSPYLQITRSTGNVTLSTGVTTPYTNMGGPLGNGQTIAWASAAGASFPNNPLWINEFVSGTPSTAGNPGFNSIIINDTNTFTGSGSMQGLSIVDNYGGTGAQGSRNALWTAMNITGPITTTSGGFYGSATLNTQVSTNLGGTGLTAATANGNVFGINPTVKANSGATFLTGLGGQENDVDGEPGSSFLAKIGMLVATIGTQAGAGGNDMAYTIGRNDRSGTAAAWNYGYGLNEPSSQWPFSSTSTLIAAFGPQSPYTGQAVANIGIDMRVPQFATGELEFQGFAVDNTGDITAQSVALTNWNIKQTGSALSVDANAASSQVSTAIAINNGGTAWVPGDLFTWGNTGVGQVTAIAATGATVAAGGTGGTAGTQTVTLSTGTCSSFPQFSVTVSAGGAITAVLSVVTPGVCTAEPITGPSTWPVTGAGLTGAQLSVSTKAEAISQLVADTGASLGTTNVATVNENCFSFYQACAGNLTINATVANSTTLDLGPTNATAINIGNSGSTTNVLGTLEQGGHTISLGGNFTTSGGGNVAFDFSGGLNATFTMTAGTAVTFPVAGTLASLSTNQTFTATQNFNQPVLMQGPGSQIVLHPTVAFTVTGSPTCTQEQFCIQSVYTGSPASLSNFQGNTFQDDVTSAPFNSDAINITHNIAPNGAVASGPRVTMDMLQSIVGTSENATTNSSAGISGTVLTITTNSTGTLAVGQGIPATVEFSGTGSITAGVLNITAVTSGTLAVGQSLPVIPSVSPSVYNVPPGTTIASLGTGSGGIGTYNLSNASASAVSGTITTTDVPIGTTIASLGTGTGGAGTYNLNNSGFLASASSLDTTGFYSFAGQNDDMRITGWLNGQLGTPGNYNGANELFNIASEEFSGTMWAGGTTMGELDFVSQSGAIFRQNLGWLYVSFEGQKGQLGGDVAEQFAGTAGDFGFSRLRSIGANGGSLSMDPYGIIDQILPINNTQSLPLGIGHDYSHAAYAGPASCEPFQCTWALQAVGITSATRLTSDGNTANGYVSEIIPTNNGTNYATSVPVTITGCSTTPVVNNYIGLGGVLVFAEPYNSGAGCEAETSATVPAPGSGVQALLAVHVTGNTMNLPISSTNRVHCDISAGDASNHSIGWHIDFGMKVGTTSLSTAIIGSPSWVEDFANSGAAAAISISTPTADTSLGAINITVTPSSGTWNIGGSCSVISNQQVL